MPQRRPACGSCLQQQPHQAAGAVPPAAGAVPPAAGAVPPAEAPVQDDGEDAAAAPAAPAPPPPPRAKRRRGSALSFRQRQRLDIRNMSRKSVVLREQLQQLESEFQRLHTQHTALAAGVVAAGQQLAVVPCSSPTRAAGTRPSDGTGAMLRLLQEQERELLQQLARLPLPPDGRAAAEAPAPAQATATATAAGSGSHSDGSRSGGADGSGGSSDGGGSGSGASPPHDPHARAVDHTKMFREFIALPPVPGAADMTLPEVLAQYRQLVRELSLALHNQRNPFLRKDAGSDAPEARIAASLRRHLSLLSSLALAGRVDILSCLHLHNAETGELCAAEGDHEARFYDWMIAEIGLTRDQMLAMAQGLKLFGSILVGVRQQRRVLQAAYGRQPHSHGCPGAAAPPPPSSACTSASCGSCSAPDGAGAGPQPRSGASPGSDALGGLTAGLFFSGTELLQQLDAEQQEANQLQLLLRKEMLAVYAQAGWLVSCLSSRQMAQVLVLCSPRVANITLLGECARRLAQEHAQQGPGQGLGAARPARSEAVEGPPLEQ